MSRKLRLGVAGLAAAALVLTGCAGGDNGDNGNSGGEPPQLITISWKASEKAGIDAVVEAFKADNPGVDVVVTVADIEQYQATLRTQLAAGSAADIMNVWPADGNPGAVWQIAPGGFLEDLSDREWAKLYPDFLRETMSYDGKVYVMGPLLNTFGSFYNQAALDEVGLTPPQVWSDVIPFCESARDAGKVAYAVGAATPHNSQNAMYQLVPSLVYAAGSDFDQRLADGSTTFSDESGWNTAISYFQEMIDAGCFNDDVTGVNNDGMLQMVANREALGVQPSAAQLSTLRTLAGDDEIIFSPFSSGDVAGEGIVAVASGGGAALNKNAKNKELSLAFIDFLGSKEGLTVYANAMRGPLPSVYYEGMELDDGILTDIQTIVDEGRAVHFLNQLWPTARVEQAMHAGLQGMFTGTSTGAQVLADMDAAYTR